jgi:hypothetical protein
LETPRCSLEIMLRYSFAFGGFPCGTCHCGWKSPEISVYILGIDTVSSEISADSCQTSLYINNINWEVFRLFICLENLYISDRVYTMTLRLTFR